MNAALRPLGAALLIAASLGCEPAAPISAETPPPDGGQNASGPNDEREGDGRDAPRPANRLADETSPYLLLHAHNPVDWYPWGPEALQKAKEENKVIFLSVGYSSCHWCHVMERESFMDEEIAARLNKHFVCIKVDREERPDIDNIYMTALQIFNQISGRGGGGGWPMSMFLTPQAKPFFGGTYFPARDGDRGAAIGFLTIIQRIQEIWEARPDDIREDAETLTELVQNQLDGRRPQAIGQLDREILANGIDALEQRFDDEYGGFGFSPANPRVPKFPEPSNLLFLVDRWHDTQMSESQRQQARRMLVATLERMSMGGIRDHLGGGFHRYSVDRYWRIPHFEKMLYDNGQLATVYSEAHRITGRDDFRRVVDEMLQFVLREMTGDHGAFYSALDAESENEEGKFYRWEKAEVEKRLSPEEWQSFAPVYGLDQPPNFEGDYYAPQFSRPLAELAQEQELSEDALDKKLAPLRAKLLSVRNQRPRPLTDTKILTSWNGLMIRGFADAGRILERPEYVEAAARAARFVLENLRTEDGRLLRTYGQGEAKLNAYLDDYAFLVDGLIALHRAAGDAAWLEAAVALTDKQIEFYWDEKDGGFFFTPDDHESLIARGKEIVDGAEPAGNSVATQNLIYLSQHLDRPDYLDKAGRTIRTASGQLQRSPASAPRMLIAVAQWLERRTAAQGDEKPGDKEPGDEKPGDKEPGDEEPGDEAPGDEE